MQLHYHSFARYLRDIYHAGERMSIGDKRVMKALCAIEATAAPQPPPGFLEEALRPVQWYSSLSSVIGL